MPTSSTCSRRSTLPRDEADLRRDTGSDQLELEFLGDWFLDPDDERRAPPTRLRALLFEAAAELPAHHIKVGNIVGTECELAADRRGLRRALRRRCRYTDAKIVYEFMPYDVQVNDVDDGARGRRGRGRAERWPCVRHLAPRQDPARAGRAQPYPAALRVLGRALRRPLRIRGGPARRGDQPSSASGRRRVPRSSTTSPCSASSDTTAPGASRCCRRSSAPSDRARSSSAPTRRRASSSPFVTRRSPGVCELPARTNG